MICVHGRALRRGREAVQRIGRDTRKIDSLRVGVTDRGSAANWPASTWCFANYQTQLSKEIHYA
jgi:hypothetical protein